MKIKRDENKKISCTPPGKISNIIFEKKNTTQAKVKIGIKITLYIVIATFLATVMAGINLKQKYGEVIQKIRQLEKSANTIILDYTKIINEVSPALVTISDSNEKFIEDNYFDGNITGIIVDDSGIILTNYSAIKGKSDIYVKLSSMASKPIKAEILVENESIDLALIKIDFEGELKAIKLADMNDIKEGQGIVVLGNAIADEYIGSSIPGIITSKNEYLEVDGKRYSLLQINAPINKKNTGGAICNSKGELVGIADLTVTNEKNEIGIYYGFQMTELQDMINSTNSFKKIMGIAEGRIIIDEGRGVNGFYIQELVKDGSAYVAGVKPTDIILEVDGYQVVDVEDVITVLQGKRKDDILHCKILRQGNMKEVDIKIIS